MCTSSLLKFYFGGRQVNSQIKNISFEPQLPNFNTVKIFRFTESNM